MYHIAMKTLSSYTPQRKMFEGRSHVVAPVVLLTVGVHNGSGGSLLYTEEELKKFPLAWNGQPVPVYHPMDDENNPVSCNSPEVLEQNNVGRVFNVQYLDGKLKGEIWVDENKARQIAPEVLSALLSGQEMEISTGLFSDDEETEGTWNGEHYDRIARHIRPDHLALLPGMTGACSLNDGCGVRANKGGAMKEKVERLAALILVGNIETSFATISNELQKWVDSKDVKNQDGSPAALHYVLDVYGDHFIYMKETPHGNKMYRQGYKVDGNNNISMEGMSEEVKREISYVSVNVNNSNPEKEDDGMAEVKKCCPDKVKAFIASDANPYTEADKEMLESLSEEQFTRISAVNYQTEKVVEKIVEKEVKANVEAPKSVDEVVANAPEDMKEVLSAGLKLHKEKKDGIVKALMGNDLNQFTQEELDVKTLSELEKLASIARVPDYSGRGSADVHGNQADGVEVLEVPTYTVNAEKK